MAETRRKFDADFREGAVRLVRETGKPIAQVAPSAGASQALGHLGRHLPARLRTPGNLAGQGAGRRAHSCWALSNSAAARGPLRNRCSVNRFRSG